MLYRWLGAVTVIVGAFFSTGCFDRSELEEQAFLIMLGLDSPKSDEVNVIARVAIPSKLSGTSGQGGSSGGGDFEQGTPLVAAKGRTINEALSLMNTGIERKINLSHLSAIIFSENTARLGLQPYLRTLSRYREFRRNHYLFVSYGDLDNLMQAQKPLLELSATRYIEDLHQTSRSLGYSPSVQVEQFLNALYSPAVDPILPVLSVGGENTEKQTKKLHFSPGHIERVGGNPVECVGTAIFQKDKMVGVLDGMETRYLQLLNGSIKQMEISVPSPFQKQNYLSVGIRLSKNATKELVLKGPKRHIKIWQNLEAELHSDQGMISYVDEKNRAILEKMIADSVEKYENRLLYKLLHKKKVAPFNFIEEARREFPSYDAYAKFPWSKTLAQLPLECHVKVVMRRLGSQLNAPIAP